jgi:hypothetical protein
MSILLERLKIMLLGKIFVIYAQVSHRTYFFVIQYMAQVFMSSMERMLIK